jgi:transaldolase
MFLKQRDAPSASGVDALASAGQSVWIDSLSRELIASGELAGLRDRGVTGLTSNPSILRAAIVGSDSYDEPLAAARRAGVSAEDALEQLLIEDIQAACDLFAGVHQRTGGAEGWVSLEVDPRIAHLPADTVRSARRLLAAVDRANAMIKVPVTRAGLTAIEELLGAGVSVNVTLAFGLAHAEDAATAHARAAHRRAARGEEVAPRSVVSVFVSRLDTLVDPQLEAGELRGRLAVANALEVLDAAQERRRRGGPRALGLEAQRLLWASTGVKDGRPPLTYVESLIAPDTVTTLPPATLEALLAAEAGSVAAPISDGSRAHAAVLERFAAAGIDRAAVAQELQRDGLALFQRAHLELLEEISMRLRLSRRARAGAPS